MRPRVLISGFTAQQVGRGNRLRYEPVADLWARGLREAGCDVDHAMCTPGMDISRYDAVLMGVIGLAGLGCSYIYGALDVVARVDPDRLTLYVDDWQLGLVRSSIGTIQRGPHRLVKPLMSYRRDYEWACQNRDHLIAGVDRLAGGNHVLYPRYNWGDPSIIEDQFPGEWRPYGVDPSALCVEYPVTQSFPEARARQWVLGILSDQREWVESLGLGWDVYYVGGKKSRAEQPLTEAELIQLYSESWGVLSPPYPISGSGWWRNRYVYAARHGCVVLSSGQECTPVGDAYRCTAAQVEAMDQGQLVVLRARQREQLLSWETPRAEVGRRLMEVLGL